MTTLDTYMEVYWSISILDLSQNLILHDMELIWMIVLLYKMGFLLLFLMLN